MQRTLIEYQNDVIAEAKRGFPILLVAAVYFYVIGSLSFFVDKKIIILIWVVGGAAIFPFGLLLARVFGINMLTKENPFGILMGVVAGIQIFYIPILIMVYQMATSYIPFAVSLLVGAHFLPYFWMYRSQTYLFVSIATGLVSLLFGVIFIGEAFTGVPFLNTIICGAGVLWILKENKEDGNQKEE